MSAQYISATQIRAPATWEADASELEDVTYAVFGALSVGLDGTNEWGRALR